MVFDIILIVLCLAAAALFRRYFNHVYRVGHEHMGKSFGIGFSAVFVLGLIVSFGKFAVPEGRGVYAVLLFLLPVLVSSFGTGCGLIAGLAGLDASRHPFIAIALVGGASAFAENFFPVGGKFIYTGVFMYGLGACLLSFTYPVAGERPEPARQSGATEYAPQEDAVAEESGRVGLDGDLSPISPEDKEEGR